jgi:hypothetical protein
MAGEFSRVGNLRALNGNLMCGITGGVGIGDPVATLSTSLTAGVNTTLACTAGTSKQIPANAGLYLIDAAGTLSTIELVTCTTLTAAAATSIPITSQTTKTTHGVGALVFLATFTPYLAIITATTPPTDNGLGSEENVTGYARQLIPWTVPTAADPPVAANSTSVTFGPLTGATGAHVETYAALMDALTGGTAPNMYAWWTLTATRTPNANDSLNVAIAALTMQSYH